MDKLRQQQEAARNGTPMDQHIHDSSSSHKPEQAPPSPQELPPGAEEWSYMDKVSYRKTGRVPASSRPQSTHMDKVKRKQIETTEHKTYMDKLKAKQMLA